MAFLLLIAFALGSQGAAAESAKRTIRRTPDFKSSARMVQSAIPTGEETSKSQDSLKPEVTQRLFREAVERVERHFEQQKLGSKAGHPRLLIQGDTAFVGFEVTLSNGQVAQASIRFLRRGDDWVFENLGILCCGDH